MAQIRRQPKDFIVIEQLGFEPSGDGEHDLVCIEKTMRTTPDVSNELAKFAGVAPRDVGYSGLKDRNAVTTQWFSVPRRQATAWSQLDVSGIRVLQADRHQKKLRRGTHRRNEFRLRLSKVDADRDALNERLSAIAAEGVPNYFGEQRFGRAGGNLDLADRLFGGQKLRRSARGFAISAARSAIFNDILAARLADATWDRLLVGDVANLDGTRSVFPVASLDDDLISRCAGADVHPTGPLWGDAAPSTQGEVRQLEHRCASVRASFADGLTRTAKEDRRPLRARVIGLSWSWQDDELLLEFCLGRGSYATSVLFELVVL